MIHHHWEGWEPESAEPPATGAQPVLVSLHFLRSELRRGWALLVGLACAGMLLGAVFATLLPAKSTGTVTLLVAHDPATDSTLAMANDISLLRTRAVAARVIDKVGLRMSPEKLQESVTVVPEGSSVLVLTVPGDSDSGAVAAAHAFATEYLAFRRAQLSAQSDALIANYRERVGELQERVDGLTRQYDVLAAGDPAAQSQAADVLAQRSQLNAEITTLQQTMESTSLQAQSTLDASHVLDPPSLVPAGDLRRLVLATGSGLVGGLGLAVGVLLLRALTSDKVRRRVDAATALGVPVVASVRGSPTGGLRAGLRSPAARSRLVAPLALELRRCVASDPGRPARVALVSVGVPEAAAQVAAAVAVELAAAGQSTVLVDLVPSARLQRAVSSALRRSPPTEGAGRAPVVLRPDGAATSGHGVVGQDQQPAAGEGADVFLTVADADPLTGLGELSSWADRAVILAAAGRSSAERLRTAAELVRGAGVDLQAAMMVGCAATDESLGRPDQTEAGTPLRGLDR